MRTDQIAADDLRVVKDAVSHTAHASEPLDVDDLPIGISPKETAAHASEPGNTPYWSEARGDLQSHRQNEHD